MRSWLTELADDNEALRAEVLRLRTEQHDLVQLCRRLKENMSELRAENAEIADRFEELR